MERYGPNDTPPAPAESSGLPKEGQDFDFFALYDAVMVPRVMARNLDLPPGARLLWAVIRQYSWFNKCCTASDADLARDVGVSDRQLRRYLAVLTKHGFLRSEPRAGATPRRFLLWKNLFYPSLQPRAQTEQAKRRHAAQRRRPPSDTASGAA